jgi:23S rRNA pseudouridine955/2504/2580 synthase
LKTSSGWGSPPILKVLVSENNKRLDQWLKSRLPNMGASLFFKLFDNKKIRVNGKRADAGTRVYSHDEIVVYDTQVSEALLAAVRPPQQNISKNESSQEDSWPQENPSPVIPLESNPLRSCVMEVGNGLLAVHKPSGMAVHPGKDQSHGRTVVECLQALYPRDTISLVHRLDRETSGLLLVAKDKIPLQEALSALQSHQIRKTYFALVKGKLKNPEGEIRIPLQRQSGSLGDRMVAAPSGQGQKSQTLYKVLEVFQHPEWGDFSLVQAEPYTGRLHQIRAHFEAIGHPLLGDGRYGDFGLNGTLRKAKVLRRLFLHAAQIQWGKQEWKSPLPPELESCLQELRT